MRVCEAFHEGSGKTIKDEWYAPAAEVIDRFNGKVDVAVRLIGFVFDHSFWGQGKITPSMDRLAAHLAKTGDKSLIEQFRAYCQQAKAAAAKSAAKHPAASGEPEPQVNKHNIDAARIKQRMRERRHNEHLQRAATKESIPAVNRPEYRVDDEKLQRCSESE